MLYSQYVDRAQRFRDLTLKRIDKDGLLPMPENYELWFVYYSRSDPELVKAVDFLVEKSGGKLSDEQCYKLFHQFLSGHREEAVVLHAGDKIKDTINDVNVAVYSAKENAAKYTKKLKVANKEIGGSKSKEEIGQILSGVVSDTNHMIENNKHLEEMLEHSSKEMEKMRHDLEVARKEAMTDPLTGLANRKAFDQEIIRLTELANNKEEPYVFSMILLDIDHFKEFNDNFGHQIGDQVLKLIARTLKDSVKGRDLAVRYGGEEFAILLPETNIQGGLKVAEILRREVEAKELVNRATGKKIAKITFSAGVAGYFKGEEIEDFIKRVDVALYEAKKAGRNQVVAAK